MLDIRKKSPESPYKKRLISIAEMANYEPVASILKQSNDFNYTILSTMISDIESNKLKKKVPNTIDVSLEDYSQNNHDQIHNGRNRGGRNRSSIIKLPRLGRNKDFGQLVTQEGTPDSMVQRHLTIDTRVEVDDIFDAQIYSRKNRAISLTSNNLISREREHSSGKGYKLISIQNTEQNQESSEGEEFEKEAKPGPGYYSVNNSTFQTKGEKNALISFGGKSPRFRYELQEQQQPAKNYPEKTEKNHEKKISIVRKKKKNFPFGSSIPKSMKQHIDQIPGPVDYNPRMGIEEDLIKKIQRNFKGSFGFCQKRFETLRKWDQMGPGRYPVQNPLPDSPSVKGSYFFVSEHSRFDDNQF